LACWLDTVQVIATSIRVIAIRDLTLRMRALLADYRLFRLAVMLVPSTRVWQAQCNGLVLEMLAIPRPRIPGGWSGKPNVTGKAALSADMLNLAFKTEVLS